MKKKLYIFDLDGTILDTLEDLAISVNYALAVFDFPPLSNKEIADRTGNGVQRLVELSVPSTADRKKRSRCLTCSSNTIFTIAPTIRARMTT